LLPTLAASEVLIYCWRRDFDAAVALGRRGVDLHPHLQVMRVNYAHALQFTVAPAPTLSDPPVLPSITYVPGSKVTLPFRSMPR